MLSSRQSPAVGIALQSEDILYELFVHLEPNVNPLHRVPYYPLRSKDEGSKTLSAAARTCKRFFHPAMKSLWKDLPSIQAIFCIFTQSLRVRREERCIFRLYEMDYRQEKPWRVTNTWSVSSSMKDSERQRFQLYASFIRTINLSIEDGVDPEVLRHLRDAGLGTHLTVPRLRAVYCRYAWPGVEEAILLFLGPSLRELSLSMFWVEQLLDPNLVGWQNYGPLRYADQKAAVRQLLASMVAAAPNLKTLDLYDITRNILPAVLDQAKYLRRLSLVDGFTEKHIDSLRGSPQLEELNYHITIFPSDPRSIVPFSGFHNLKTLAVSHSHGDFPTFCTALPDLHLTELRVRRFGHCGGTPPPRNLATCFYPSLRSSLRRIYIDHDDMDHDTSVLELIVPCLSLPNIQNFTMTTRGNAWLDDEELRVIGQTWPKLVSLNLQYTQSSTNPCTAPTVHGVAAIVSLCADLQCLSLALVTTLNPQLLVQPPFVLSGKRWIPENVDIPDDCIRETDLKRLTGIVHPLFGVFYPTRWTPCSGRWYTVLQEMARLQDVQLVHGRDKYRELALFGHRSHEHLPWCQVLGRVLCDLW